MRDCLCGEGKRFAKAKQEQKRLKNEVGLNIKTLILKTWHVFLLQARLLAKSMRPIQRQSLKRESGIWDYEEEEYKLGGINDSTKGIDGNKTNVCDSTYWEL